MNLRECDSIEEILFKAKRERLYYSLGTFASYTAGCISEGILIGQDKISLGLKIVFGATVTISGTGSYFGLVRPAEQQVRSIEDYVLTRTALEDIDRPAESEIEAMDHAYSPPNLKLLLGLKEPPYNQDAN